MIETVVKVAITSILIVAIAEVAKRSSMFGALIASLPLTSVLAMIWLHLDTGDTTKIASLSTGIFWLVLPSLILFLALPALLAQGISFPISLAIASALTIVGYFIMLAALRQFGIAV